MKSGAFSCPAVGLVFEASVDFVVILDHGQFALLFLLSNIGLRHVLVVDEVVDLGRVSQLHLHPGHVLDVSILFVS